MKRFSVIGLLISAFTFLAAGCGLFELSDSSDIVSGDWTSNVAAVAGDCCHLELALESHEGDVSGTGLVETPGNRIGISEEFTIRVTGTVIDDRVRLTLDSTNNPGLIEGHVERNSSLGFDRILRVNFEGFGFEGRDIVLFPKATR